MIDSFGKAFASVKGATSEACALRVDTLSRPWPPYESKNSQNGRFFAMVRSMLIDTYRANSNF